MNMRYVAHSCGGLPSAGLIALRAALVLTVVGTAYGVDPKQPGGEATARALLKEQANAQFNLVDSTIVTLRIDNTPTVPLTTVIPIDDELYTIALDPCSVRSSDYGIKVQRADGSYVDREPGPIRTLRGRLAEVADSVVAASRLEDGLYARIMVPDGASWWVEPLGSHVATAGPEQYVVYRDDDVTAAGGSCIALDPPGWAATQLGTISGMPGEDVFIAELGIDTDWNYYLEFAQELDPEAATEARVNEIVNAVNIQYERDVNITHVITTIIVRPDPRDPRYPYSGLDPVGLLTQFTEEWNTEQAHIPRDLAQLFTGRDFIGDTIGIAWVGQVCTGYAYSVIQPTCCSSFACQTDLSAHELGHNWGARHCGYEGPDDDDDCVPECPGWTMNCQITCANRFHETLTQPDILKHRNSRTCLDQGDELRRLFLRAETNTVPEGSTLSFTAVADFRFSEDQDITTEAIWSLDRGEAGSINANGVLTAFDVSGDTCVVVSASYTYNDVTRTTDKTGVVMDTEAPLTIVSSYPPDGAIDARQPSEPDGSNPVGWESLEITFNGDTCLITAEDFFVATEGRANSTTSILDLEQVGPRTIRLLLSHAIDVGAWTTVTHTGSGAKVRVGSLPGDVNGDATAAPDDVLDLIGNLQGLSDPPLDLWQSDVNRSGGCTPADILRVIDLLNGAGDYAVWNSASLP